MNQSFKNIKYYLLIYSFLLLLVSESTLAKKYWSGEVNTKQTYLYGRIEVRMKSAEASGVTSTLFTYNTKNSIYNEIDIEIMGRYNNEVSYNTFVPDQTGNPHRQIVNFNPHRAFHIYTIEWTPDYVAWCVDGFEIYRQNDERIKTLNLPQSIMMNFWPPNSADWAGTLDESKLPLYAFYDWVKYYEYTPGTGDNFTLKWQDDFNSFDQTKWSASNSTFGSNLADFKSSNVVVEDGYLILCMKKEGETGYSGGPVKDVDIDAPYLVYTKAYNNNVSIFFSEALDKITAETVVNYVIPGANVKIAQLDSDLRTVHLTVEGLNPSGSQNLIVRSIKDLANPANMMSAKSIIIKYFPLLPLKINLGGDLFGEYLASQDWEFGKDYGSIGGKIINNNSEITGTTEPYIYKSAIDGITFFKARVPNGIYNIILMMTETEFNNSGSRVFDVYCNGKLETENLDVFQQAGINAAYEKQLSHIIVNDELIELFFKGKAGKPIISGIKIELVPTDVKLGLPNIPLIFNIENFPNPFNPTTKIKYVIPMDAFVSIKVFDTLGNEVASLVNEQKQKGNYEIEFSANDGKSRLASGVYICSIQAGGQIKSTKMVLLK
ncbi:MAG: family 16 glycosylhydrolase [Ignavibacteriales bacterium]|nr:family 16 glycosylhydrolase [Ignavibacteriales bacterium]